MALRKIDTIEELHKYLKVALQLEHATIPPYLTALYSLHPEKNQDARFIIRTVLVEEMLHMTLVANMINAIGFKPDLTVKNFIPKYPTPLPCGIRDFKVSLAPFSLQTLKDFKNIERPGLMDEFNIARDDLEKIDLDTLPKGCIRSIEKGIGELYDAMIVEDENGVEYRFYSIGEFYDAIFEGFEKLEKEAKNTKKTIFIGEPPKQITNRYYYSGGAKVIEVKDMNSVKEVIEMIKNQGEGSSTKESFSIFASDEERELSHYFRFDQLERSRYYIKGDKPREPTGEKIEVDWDSVYKIKTNPRIDDYTQNPELYSATFSFNRYYKDVLAQITRAFNGEPELLMQGVHSMFKIKEMATQIIRNHLPNDNSLFAGPTFELELSENQKEAFLEFSSAVTDFDKFTIRGTGQVDEYIDTILNIVSPEVFAYLILTFAQIIKDSKGSKESYEQYMRERIFNNEKLKPIAQNIIKLWYTGIWNKLPEEWFEKYANPNVENEIFNVSDNAYIEGLVWKAIGANPFGAKAQGYGSWTNPPIIDYSNNWNFPQTNN